MASAMTTVVEGTVHYRHKRKWRVRWCVIKKPSPVADRLQVLLFKERKDVLKGGAKSSFPVEGFFGLESGFTLDKQNNVLAVICQRQVHLFAFPSREILILFEVRIRASLGEEQQFPVHVVKAPSHSPLQNEPTRMLIHGNALCLTGRVPPKILMSWNLSDLRRYGPVDGKFVLEGGSRCAKGSGLHVLLTNQAIDIMNVLQLASVGRNPLHTGALHRRSQAASIMDYLTSLDSESTKSRFMPLLQPPTAPVRPEFDETNRSMKRHSISVTEWQWQGPSDVDKQRLISIENMDRARLLALYDIPPRRIRPVEKNENDIILPQTLQDQPVRNNIRRVSDDVVDSSLIVTIFHSDSMPNLNQDEEHHMNNSYLNKNSNNESHLVQISQLQPHVGREEYDGDLDNDSVFEIDEISLVNMADDKSEVTGLSTDNTKTALLTVESSHMQELIQTEEDLQKELALLDAMLQDCQSNKSSIIDVNLNKSSSDIPTHCSSSLQNHNDAKLVIEGMVHDGSSYSTSNIKLSAQNLVTDKCADRNNVFRYDLVESSGLLSPNLLGKLEQIPHNSKLAIPLQYVNLDKYDVVDDNVTNTHVYCPPLSSSTEEQNPALVYPYDNMNPSLQNNMNKQNKCSNHNIATSDTVCVRPAVPKRRKSSDSEILLLPPAPPPPLPPEDPPERPPRVVKADLPPPELPPKVPSFLRKHSDYVNPSNAAPSSKVTDFIFVDRSKKPHRTLQQIPEQNIDAHVPLPSDQPNYMIMTPAEADSEALYRLNDSKTSLSSCSNAEYIDDQISIYMPMSGPHESSLHISLSAPKLSRTSSLDTGFCTDTNIASFPISPPSAGKPKFRHSHSVDGQTMSNYMEMSHFESPSKSNVLHNLEALQSYVLTTPAGASPGTISVSSYDPQSLNNSDVNIKASSEQLSMSAPFPNLIKFAGYRANKLCLNQKEGIINDENSISSSELDKSMNNPSKTSFLSRFLRRSSRGRNSAQSQENLANISLSRESVVSIDKVSPVKDDDTVKMARQAKTGSTCLSRFSLIGAPELVARHRSLSIPNGVCCLERMQGENDSSTNTQNASSTVSSVSSLDKRRSQSEETLKHLIGIGESERFSHYSQDDQQLPVPDFRSRYDKDNGINADVYSVMDNREFRQKLFKDPANDFSSQGSCLAKDSSNTCVSSQTDDQKLLALFIAANQSNLIKPLSDESIPSFLANPDMSASNIENYVKALSPTEQAAAIAKHVTSLAPFIPPKTKTSPTFSPCLVVPSCSTSLEAIDARVAVTSNHLRTSADFNPKPSSTSLTVLPSPSAFSDADCESPTDPASWKRQARESLRIMPPIQDENGNIWIARQNRALSPDRLVGGRSSLVVPHDEASGSKIGGGDTGMSATAQVRVDKLGEVREHIDALSLSSAHSSFADDTPLRSSPASTILRPRSGKEYRQIDRRGQIVHTCTSTTPTTTTTTTTTPRSTGTNSSLVFTFDSPQSPSCRSSQSRERDSPKSPSVYVRGGIPASMGSSRVNHAYVNLGKVSDKSSSLEIYTPYVNVDMTPPSSPNYQLPMEQIDPHLNYAEIDLSCTGHSGSSSSDRSKNKNSSTSKKIQKAATIEYAMIDLVATAAVQKLSKEHAQYRGEDSLRRTGRKFSAPVLARGEKRSNVPLVSRFVERDRKLSTSSCESNG